MHIVYNIGTMEKHIKERKYVLPTWGYIQSDHGRKRDCIYD